jgi:Holliday junction resolvasome RuvABC endonuclease subunit
LLEDKVIDMPKKKTLTKVEKEKLLKANSKILKRILKKKKSIMGFDLSTTATGFYHLNLVDDSQSFGILIKGGNKKINNRIVKILDAIDVLLINSKDSMAVIEDYSFGLRGSSVAQLAELGGCVKTTLIRSGICYLTLAPQTLKKFVLGPARGSASGKEFMLMQVLDTWGKKFNSSDECDAFCLAKFLDELRMFLYGYECLKWKEKMFQDFITNRGLPIS